MFFVPDTDALPIDEQNKSSFKSTMPGIMHACGHDLHTACLLAAAKVLCSAKDQWQGTIVVLFQPSEEVAPGGALSMIQEKAFPDSVDAVFGLHVSSDHNAGQVGIKSGRDYSGVMDFDVTITGRGGHGATPHMTSDPIVCACSSILALQTLVSRECPAWEPSVISVGSLHAGTKHNIIPGEAVFSGTVRTFSEEHRKFLQRRIREIVSAVTLSHQTIGSCTFTKGYPPGFNNEALSHRAEETLSALLGKRSIVIRTVPYYVCRRFCLFSAESAWFICPSWRKKKPGAKKNSRHSQRLF